MGELATSKTLVEIEGQRGVLQIIMVLHEKGELLYGNLYNNKPLVEISNNSTAKRALGILLKQKFIREKIVRSRKAKYYCLTEKGERFAKLLVKMEQLLEEKP